MPISKYQKQVSYWTKERVRNGLRRFVRDYFEGNEKNLPPRAHNFRHAIPEADQRNAQRLRLYPTYSVILRHYASLVEAWTDIGYEVRETPLAYWTHDEVIAGLKRFFKDFGFCPTYHGYLEHAQFTEKHNKKGEVSPTGAYNKYPGFLSIRKYFSTMREAWTAAGCEVDQHWEPWSAIEDWFILESVGILPRDEVSEIMKRTAPAIKRRLYDLGRINSMNRWGITINAAGILLGIGGHVIQKYLEYGFIPYFRGNKCIYLNPADLLAVGEFDWSSVEQSSELYRLVKKAQIQRVLKIIKYGAAWRAHEIYKFQPTRKYYAGKIKNPRRSAFADKSPVPPNDLKIDDWVTLKMRFRMVSENRLGRITGIFYSPSKHPRPDGTKRSCWIANVDFPKIKRFTPAGENRVRYNLPLDILQLAEKPEVEPKPLSMNDEAIRSRHRRTKYVHRAGANLQRIREELT
jgi:hypothetical protein